MWNLVHMPRYFWISEKFLPLAYIIYIDHWIALLMMTWILFSIDLGCFHPMWLCKPLIYVFSDSIPHPSFRCFINYVLFDVFRFLLSMPLEERFKKLLCEVSQNLGWKYEFVLEVAAGLTYWMNFYSVSTFTCVCVYGVDIWKASMCISLVFWVQLY